MRKILSFLTAILFAGSMMATDVDVVIYASSGDYYAKTHEWVKGSESGPQYQQVVLDEVITANLIGSGNNGKYYSDWRFYTNGSEDGSFSIDAAEGYVLKSATFTYTTSNNGALYFGETKLTSKTAVELSGNKAVFQCKNTNSNTNGQVRLTAIAVTYDVAGEEPPVEPKTSWTVAGSSDVAFGTTWAPTNTANDMVKQEDGSYKWEKTELELAAGSILFKVCKDHAWTEAYPSENYELAIAEGGIYTITITFEPENENKVSAVATKTGEAVVIPSIAMHGNFTGSWKDTENFELAEGKATASLALTLAEGNYEFGMRIGGSGNWTSNGAAFTRENPSHEVVSGSGNLTLAADAAGEYLFTWTFETNTLAITFPEKPEPQPVVENVVYNWAKDEAKQVGTTFFGNSDETVSTVKIHSNTDDVDCIKFGKSYVYADGKYIAIKPAEGAFKAGDTLKVAVCFNNSDATKYCMVDVFAADGESRLWRTDSATTVNGRTSAADPAIQTYVLEADQDSLLLGRYGNTGMCVTFLQVVRPAEEPIGAPTYFVAGNMNEWTANDDYKLAANPEQEGEFIGEFDFAADAEFKVIMTNGSAEYTWYPEGDNYKITEAGTYKIFFRPAGGMPTPEWYGGYFKVIMKEEPIVPTITCAAVYELAKGDDAALNDVVVTFANGKNVWVKDETASMLIYLPADGSWKAGDVLSGVAGTVDIYNGVTEVKPTADQAAAVTATAGEAPAPEALETVTTADVNKYIVLKSVEVEGSFPEGSQANLTIADVTFRNQFKNGFTFEAGKKYDVTGVVTIYKNNPQVYFITATESAAPADPTAAVTGDMTKWGDPIPFQLSEDKKKATLYNDNIKAGTYEFKMIINGDWRSNGYEFHRGFPGCAGISGNVEANMTVVVDVEGAYTFEWYFENDSLAIIFPEKPAPVLTDGYYLMGSFNEWKIVADNLFQNNIDAEGEFVLDINLTEGDEIKVAYVEADEAKLWFPKGDNYVVDKNHSGATIMYFRPEYNEAWYAFGGYFYIVPTSTEGIEETLSEGKAVKVLREGNILILKGEHTYTVMGQIVK